MQLLMLVWYTFAAQRRNDLQSHHKEKGEDDLPAFLYHHTGQSVTSAEFTENKELKTRTTVAVHTEDSSQK